MQRKLWRKRLVPENILIEPFDLTTHLASWRTLMKSCFPTSNWEVIPTGRTWIATNGRHVIGAVSVIGPQPCWLGVREKWRRRGIGMALFETALAHMRLERYRSVYLIPDPPTEANMALYRKAGFQEIEL